jgi:hypothetical protein
MKVRRRCHRESDVCTTATHLHLVVHDHRPRAALDTHLRNCACLVLAVIVTDDRDYVSLFYREADIDNESSILQEIC